ncbi:hypothetical protein ACFWIX_14125 [Pseudarthrobacter sp. NPDC058362]|uniref:hypothetical protein n=1 Tax=Pseudarthrobacter sp. NPDC058362 TaxID=3346458 RepID=UPI00365A8DD2
MNEQEQVSGAEVEHGIPGKSRQVYRDPRGSEATRELRDTARRRRDAEEKLQQHLMEAKNHIPNEFRQH